MVSNQTVEEYYQFRETMRPFLEEKMGLASDCQLQDAIEAIEQLFDFKDYLAENDPDMLDQCAEMLLVAKVILQSHITKNGGKKYLQDSDLEKIQGSLKF